MLKRINGMLIASGMAMCTIFLTSCGESNTPTPVALEKPLPSSGESQDGVFASTGEVVVFFIIDKSARGENLMASNDEIMAFQKAAEEVQSQLKDMGISSYMSAIPDIKITISESSKYVMNANASEKGIGFVMSKAGSQPQMVTKELTTDLIMAKIKTFYNK